MSQEKKLILRMGRKMLNHKVFRHALNKNFLDAPLCQGFKIEK